MVRCAVFFFRDDDVRLLILIVGKAVNGTRRYHQDLDVWKQAPILKGTTNFEPRPDVKNIMVTGGAGFM